MNLSCPDWFEKLKRGETPIPELDLDEVEAARAVKVFNKLHLPDVPGRPTMAEAAGDWNRDLIAALFGSVIVKDGKITGRRIRKIFELVPKKNAKTTKGAAIMMTALLLNTRPRAEFLLVGPTQETADLAFSQAVGMIESDEEGYLQNRFLVKDHQKTIVDRSTKARLKIKSFDNKVMTGSKPVGVLIDELHELGKFSFASKVMAQIRGGIIANPEGFIVMITTQSDEPPSGVFKSELEYARQIRDGEAEGDLLPILFEFPIEMQADPAKPWRDVENWPIVLPNLGRSITLDILKSEFAEADKKGIEELSIWASQHLNIQIGVALNRDGWAGARYWQQAIDPEPVTMDSLLQRCEVITAGIDGGGLDDLLGLCLCGRDSVSKDWLFWFKAWAQPIVLERRKDIADRLQSFAAAGELTICEYPTQDVDEIAGIVNAVANAGLFPEKYGIGLDAVGVAAITDAIAAQGVDPDLMVAVSQGYKLNGAIKGFERKLMDGTAWHGGQDLMTWCVGNAKTELRGSATLITKQVSGSAKIDPLMAGFNAFQLMARNPGSVGKSVYEERGLMMV